MWTYRGAQGDTDENLELRGWLLEFADSIDALVDSNQWVKSDRWVKTVEVR